MFLKKISFPKLFSLVLILLTQNISYGCSFYPKVILHKDINKTIIAEDPAGDKTIDDVLIHSLAEQYFDRWDISIAKPISYTEYIKQHVLPGNKGDAQLKKMRNQKISGFIDYLRSTSHHYYYEVNERYQKLRNKILTSKSVIFNSFYREIEFMEQHAIPYSIVLRTFGKDLDRIIEEIHKHISPTFFSWRGVFKNGVLELSSLQSNETITLHSTEQIYEFLKNHGNLALQDDWCTWNAHGECQQFGKLFPVDCDDCSVITYFADDNGHPTDGILNPRHPITNAIGNVDALIKSKHICVADMLKAIEDDEYYVQHLKCLLQRNETVDLI
jgi:hypothetical protein